jgi:hypothetical protein
MKANVLAVLGLICAAAAFAQPRMPKGRGLGIVPVP